MFANAAQELLEFIDAAPTPYHAVEQVRKQLEAESFVELAEAAQWELKAGLRVYVVRDATIAAFVIGSDPVAQSGFRLIGAHVDSPNLRVKPKPNLSRQGSVSLAVEPYGGLLLHTWLDRDLGVAGRVALRDGKRIVSHLVDLRTPLLRIPSLAIHLNRKVNKEGLLLDKQKHLPPLLALADDAEFCLENLIATELDGVSVDDILGWDLCLFDLQNATFSGADQEFIHAGRIDNLASCHAALSALFASSQEQAATRGIVLYDHEEVGSRSAAGAASSFLEDTLLRIAGGEHEAYRRAIANSFLISADMAHALHPNYADKHEPNHQPLLGKGPVIKINSDQAYATSGETAAAFEAWARDVEVETQRFVVRSDMACGSTIGPITATRIGIRTVDVGNPMLSMHSCRELAARADVAPMIQVMQRFFTVDAL